MQECQTNHLITKYRYSICIPFNIPPHATAPARPAPHTARKLVISSATEGKDMLSPEPLPPSLTKMG